MEPIAHIQTDFAQKFGIPRQSGIVNELEGRIVFEPTYAIPDAVRGLDAFSHIWLLWEFECDNEPDATNPIDSARTAKAASTSSFANPTGSASVASTSSFANPTGSANAANAVSLSDATKSANAISNANPTNTTVKQASSWSPLVRPPRLGGDKKMGVFATRSPNRPNRIGLSCVKLLRVAFEDAQQVYSSGKGGINDKNGATYTKSTTFKNSSSNYDSIGNPISDCSAKLTTASVLIPQGLVPVLYVGGADLRNNTPIFDIKPYLPEFDAHPEASGGFTENKPWHKLPVDISPKLLARIPENKREALLGILAEDPRPARMHIHEDSKEYKLSFAQKEIRFTVSGSADSCAIHVVAVN